MAYLKKRFDGCGPLTEKVSQACFKLKKKRKVSTKSMAFMCLIAAKDCPE